MSNSYKDKLVGGIIVLTVLLAVTTPLWVKQISTITDLFNDNTAIGLLAATVILLTWYNCKLGVAFAVLVAMVSVAVKTDGFRNYVESFVTVPKKSEPVNFAKKSEVIRNPNSLSIVKKAKETGLSAKIKGLSKATDKSGKLLVDKAKFEAFQDVNLIPSGNNSMEPENGAKIIQDKMNAQMTVTRPCDKDFMTHSKGTDYHGYDIAGCRYDLKAGTQNGSKYGPPLSWCETYKNNKHAVPFYPLNG